MKLSRGQLSLNVFFFSFLAIYDTFEALKWINKNIDAFGGDSHQVTIAGGSVGAVTVGIFCTSPLTKGLFNRAILQSGSPASLKMKNNIENMN